MAGKGGKGKDGKDKGKKGKDKGDRSLWSDTVAVILRRDCAEALLQIAECDERRTEIFVSVAHGKIQLCCDISRGCGERFEVKEPAIQKVRRDDVTDGIEH